MRAVAPNRHALESARCDNAGMAETSDELQRGETADDGAAPSWRYKAWGFVVVSSGAGLTFLTIGIVIGLIIGRMDRAEWLSTIVGMLVSAKLLWSGILHRREERR